MHTPCIRLNCCSLNTRFLTVGAAFSLLSGYLLARRDSPFITYCPHCFQSRGPAAVRERAERETAAAFCSTISPRKNRERPVRVHTIRTGSLVQIHPGSAAHFVTSGAAAIQRLFICSPQPTVLPTAILQFSFAAHAKLRKITRNFGILCRCCCSNCRLHACVEPFPRTCNRNQYPKQRVRRRSVAPPVLLP